MNWGAKGIARDAGMLKHEVCENHPLVMPCLERQSGGVVLAKVYSCAVVGLDGVLVEVEVDVSQGVPATVVVGLPDAAVRESQDRVRAAIRNSGGKFPVGRVAMKLAGFYQTSPPVHVDAAKFRHGIIREIESNSMRLLDKADLLMLAMLGAGSAAAGIYGAAQSLALLPGLFAQAINW